MDLNDPHYIDVLKSLNEEGIRHILVGGLAVGYHGYARYTGDMDLWIEPTNESMLKLSSALVKLGYDPEVVHRIMNERTFDHPTPIRVISESGKKVDLMTTVYNANFSFDECFEASHKHDELGTRINIIHINQLIYLKERTNRYGNNMQDLVDAQKLKEIKAKNK